VCRVYGFRRNTQQEQQKHEVYIYISKVEHKKNEVKKKEKRYRRGIFHTYFIFVTCYGFIVNK
jgi:hypothetical protein